MNNKPESNFNTTPPPEKEVSVEKVNELLNTLNKETANIHEIIDGGWGTFQFDQSEIRNKIYHDLIEIRDLTEAIFKIDSQPQRYDYALLQENIKYLKSLGVNLNNIKLLIDQIEMKPNVRLTLQNLVQDAIDKYSLLTISD